MNRLVILSAIILYSTVVASSQSTHQKCSATSLVSATHWGHEHMVIDRRERPVHSLRGIVQTMMGEPVGGVLVQVFSRKPSAPFPQQSDQPNPLPAVAACITVNTGNIAFNLPSGEYEVRASKEEWNSTSVLFIVNPRIHNTMRIKIPLQPGD